MFKRLSTLFIFGLAYLGPAPAQELNEGHADVMSGPAVEMMQDSPFVYPPAAHNQFMPPPGVSDHGHHYNRPSHRGPVVVLPMPLPMPPMGGTAGLNGMYGYHYPGSYIPRDTPLHKFSGYVVCDPPNLAAEAAAGTTARAAQRVVKTTSTRSLAAPGHSQPCPVYTINGEFLMQKGNTTATAPPVRQGPQVTPGGERQ